MEILVILYSILAFFVAVSVLSYFGSNQDLKQKRIEYIDGTSKLPVFEDLDKSFYERFIAPLIKKIRTKLPKVNLKKNQNPAAANAKFEQTERMLRLAGVNMSAPDFIFIKNITAVITTIVALIVALAIKSDPLIMLLIILVGLMLGMIAPTYILRSKVNSYQEAIRNQLPDAMDLLGVCIEAGLSFDAALIKVAEKLEGPFITELKILYREIQMGKPRREALRSLGENSNIQELKTFSAALAQADQLGIPINNVMKVQSEQLRETRRQMAREKGMKAPIKMMLPMVAFIFPVIFIIILGPTVLTIMDHFL
ncbi:MAG: type II secretion system F family protein [Acutalibacteraceae bacterium]|jgi:tight adherence protein C